MGIVKFIFLNHLTSRYYSSSLHAHVDHLLGTYSEISVDACNIYSSYLTITMINYHILTYSTFLVQTMKNPLKQDDVFCYSVHLLMINYFMGCL